MDIKNVYKTWRKSESLVSREELTGLLEELKAKTTRMSLNETYYDELAAVIRTMLTVYRKTPIGSMMQCVMDNIILQCEDEGFFGNNTEIVDFIVKSGSSNKDLTAIRLIGLVREQYKCKKCGASLLGECSIVVCSECKAEYFINTPPTVSMCKSCISYNIKIRGGCWGAKIAKLNESTVIPIESGSINIIERCFI